MEAVAGGLTRQEQQPESNRQEVMRIIGLSVMHLIPCIEWAGCSRPARESGSSRQVLAAAG